jgi:DNA-binding transcriptional regulator YiaG
MPNIARILREEVSRLARREVRISLEKARKSVTRHQLQIASLKGQVKTLVRQVSALEKNLARSEAMSRAETVTKEVRFGPRGVVSTRRRLGLSAADLASLMGVTAQTVYNWEREATRPNRQQQAKLASLRSVGKRQMQAHLATRRA